MGRITNTIGVRLGHSLSWFHRGVGYRFKEEGPKAFSFLKYVEHFIRYKVVEVSVLKYIFGDIKVIYGLKSVTLVIFMYRPNTRWKKGTIWQTRKKKYYYRFYKSTALLRKWLVYAGEVYFGVPCKVAFISTTNHSLDAKVILTYIQLKLKQGFSLNEVIYPLARLLRKYRLLGFRVECKGRLTRRQRASFKRLQIGRVPFSSLKYPIQFATGTMLLKYGKCGLKVWLCTGKRGKIGYEM